MNNQEKIMAKFGNEVWALIKNEWWGFVYDGYVGEDGEIMEIAKKCGLVELVPYNPKIHIKLNLASPGQKIWYWVSE